MNRFSPSWIWFALAVAALLTALIAKGMALLFSVLAIVFLIAGFVFLLRR